MSLNNDVRLFLFLKVSWTCVLHMYPSSLYIIKNIFSRPISNLRTTFFGLRRVFNIKVELKANLWSAKQYNPPEVFSRKRCSEYMKQTYTRTHIPKCDFNNFLVEIALWHVCSPVNSLHIFKTTFPRNTSGWLLLKIKNPLPAKFPYLLCTHHCSMQTLDFDLITNVWCNLVIYMIFILS